MTPDYEFYTDEYHGIKITEADFPRLIARASAYLKRACSTDHIPEKDYKNALCAVAEAWQINEEGGDIASQSVGSWSKHFVTAKPKTNEQRLAEAAELYLGSSCSLTVRWV